MLGFVPFASTAISQAVINTSVLALMSSTVSQGYVSSLTTDAKAVQALSGVSTTGNVAVGFDAKAAVQVAEAIASTSINDLVDIDAQATIIPSAATASIVVAAFQDVDAKATTYLGNTFSVTAVSDVDFDAKANITTNSIVLSTAVSDIAELHAKALIATASVSATFDLSIEYDAQAITTLGTPPLLTTAINAFTNIDAQASASISGVNLQINNFVFEDVDAKAEIYLTGVYADADVSLDDPTAIRFPYQANAYDRSRTIYVISYDNNDSVHVIGQDNTVFIDMPYVNNVVYVETQDTTVYIDARSQQNTVYIAA